MVEELPMAQQADLEPPDEESVFSADFERQWEFEGSVKENLIWDLLRPRFELAEEMKASADRTVQEISAFTADITLMFNRGETDAIKQLILD